MFSGAAVTPYRRPRLSPRRKWPPGAGSHWHMSPSSWHGSAGRRGRNAATRGQPPLSSPVLRSDIIAERLAIKRKDPPPQITPPIDARRITPPFHRRFRIPLIIASLPPKVSSASPSTVSESRPVVFRPVAASPGAIPVGNGFVVPMPRLLAARVRHPLTWFAYSPWQTIVKRRLSLLTRPPWPWTFNSTPGRQGRRPVSPGTRSSSNFGIRVSAGRQRPAATPAFEPRPIAAVFDNSTVIQGPEPVPGWSRRR